MSEGEVHIGLTGLFSSLGLVSDSVANDLLNAWRAYIADVNAAGGVHGRRVVLDVEDTGGATAASGVDAARRVEGRVLFNCACQGADVAIGAADYLDERGMPTLVATGTEEFASSLRHGYIVVPTTEDMVRRSLEFMANELGMRGQTVGMIRTNQQTFAPGDHVFDSYAPELGITPGPIRVVEFTQPSFIAEMSAMREAGAAGVLCFCTLEIGGMVRDGKAIGYRPTISGPTFTFDLFAQAYAGELDGIRALRLGGASNTQPAYSQYSESVRRNFGRPPSSDAFLYWGFAQILVEILERAGPDPTRARVENAMAALREFGTGGAVAPVTFEPDTHIGTRAMLPVQCCNAQSQWQSTGEYRSRFR